MGYIKTELPPHQLDHPDGPHCRCGKPSRFRSGWCGKCFPYKSEPELPFHVHDDEGNRWSSHLVGAPHALEHYDLAIAHGIKNPTITDKDGNDITEWTLAQRERQ